jgi:hypothetical protein
MKGLGAAGVYHAAPEGGDATKPRAIAQYLVKLTSKAMVENGVLVSKLNRFYGSVAVSAADVCCSRIGSNGYSKLLGMCREECDAERLTTSDTATGR